MSAALWAGVLFFGAASWFVAAVAFTRALTTRWGYCHIESGYGSTIRKGRAKCRADHYKTCWRTDTEVGVRQVLRGSAMALVWPLALPLLAVAVLARPRPTSDAAYIARLERELRIAP